jgi:hypothetical protein
MTPAVIVSVVAEIKAYGRGERSEPLSWAGIVAFSGFSQVSLWKKPAIKAAFQEIRDSQRRDATPPVKAPRTVDERIAAADAIVAQLRATLAAFDERWTLYEYNVQRLGIDPDELRRPLDPVAREVIRSRRAALAIAKRRL